MKKQKKIHILLIGVLLLSVGLMTVEAKPKKTHAFTENIVLGGVFPIVKRPEAGRDRRDAFLIAVEIINAQTGDDRILPAGINFTAIVKDDDNTAAGGTSAAKALIGDDVDVVIGSSGSSVSIAMAAELGPEKIVQLSYASSSPALTDRTLYPYFMRNCASDADQGHALFDLVDAMGWTTGATISTDDSYGTGLITAFTGYFEAGGGTIATAQKFAPGATDVSAQVQAIKDATGVEFVLANMIDKDGQTLFKKAKELGLTDGETLAVPWIITDGTTTTSTFEGEATVQAAMQKFIGTTPAPLTGAGYAAFAKIWNDPKWGEYPGPAVSQVTGVAFNSYAPFAYDAVFIVATALAAAGTADGDTLLPKMYDVELDGASGQIKFNADGELFGRFDYVTLSGTTYNSFGIWNGTGYADETATAFDLPDGEELDPAALGWDEYTPEVIPITTTGTTTTATATGTSETEATKTKTKTSEAGPGFEVLPLLLTFAAVIIIYRRCRK